MNEGAKAMNEVAEGVNEGAEGVNKVAEAVNEVAEALNSYGNAANQFFYILWNAKKNMIFNNPVFKTKLILAFHHSIKNLL